MNNNCYTNLMVQAQLRFAVQVVEILKRQCYAKYDALVLKIGLKRKEIQMWAHAAEHMFVPYDQRLGIHPQDDTFLLKEKWDLEATPAHKFPLLLHYHPLNLYRKQVCTCAECCGSGDLRPAGGEMRRVSGCWEGAVTAGGDGRSVAIGGGQVL